MNGFNNNLNKNLKICDYLEDFVSGKLNSCIICYITDLNDVKTLDYQFFGINNKESNVILQNDYMQSYLNENLFKKYKKLINSTNSNYINFFDFFSQNNELLKVFSFTNFIENNKDQKTVISQLKNNFNNIKNMINNNNNVINPKLLPCVWQINYNKNLNVTKDSNLSNTCGFTLSTSGKYNNQVKYIEIDENNKVSLSLFPGGINKKLMCENVKIISKSNNLSKNNFIAFTSNIKANNNLYLMPSDYKEGIKNNSTSVTMKEKSDLNGKWLIIGFNIGSINELKITLDQVLL
jgi:hypothetical protein